MTFVGEIYRPAAELTFGRQADLSLDDNNFLHRRAGRFRLRDNTWWLENIGSRLRLTMVSSDGSLLDLQPGSSSPLLGDRGEISVTAGPTRYSMEYDLQHIQMAITDSSSFRISGADTMTYGPILTPQISAISPWEGMGPRRPVNRPCAITTTKSSSRGVRIGP
ncbi:MAG: hypothetical protein AAGK32_14590 [Actinomycetota bacterium]